MSKIISNLERITERFDGYCEKHPIKTLIISTFVALGTCFYLLLQEIEAKHKYDDACKTLIKVADTDRNGILSLQEQAELWRRMGYESPFVEGINLTEKLQSYHDIIEFYYDKIPRVIKAIKSYKRQN